MSIQVSDINPLRFIDNSNINNGFDGNYYADRLNWYQTRACYFQTWLKSDRLKLQVVANEVPDDLQFKDSYDTVIDSATWQDKNLSFPSIPDARVYEIDYPLVNLPLGIYQAVFNNYGSEPFEIKDFDERTMLIKYRNSQNDYSAVFDTGIEFQIRLHASIHNYRPQNDRASFIDQRHNPTQLSSIAFRRFTFTIGTRDIGVPEWIVDKYNILSQCDQISYDGIFYQFAEDAEGEIEPNQDYGFIWEYNIDIEPVDNNFIRYITQPDGSGVQTFTPVQKVTPYSNLAGNFNVQNVFKNFSMLENIVLYKVGADFILNIGITPNGGEIVSNWNVDESVNDIEVNYPFNGTETIYFSGSGLNASMMFLLWKQLDEPPVPVSPVASPNIAKNAGVFFFELSPGDLAASFDLATGIGFQNGSWKDWVIAGTNNTPDMAGKLPIGWDRADTITIGTEKGSSTITIGRVNLPSEGLGMFTDTYVTNPSYPSGKQPIAGIRDKGSQDYNYEIAQGNGPISKGITENMGNAEPLPFTPLSLVCVYVIKIA